MTILDSKWKNHVKDWYCYSGKKYYHLKNRNLNGTELNYIGVGMGFAAKYSQAPMGWAAMAIGVAAWKLWSYGQYPSKNVNAAALTGWEAWSQR